MEFGAAASYTFFDSLTLSVTDWWAPNNSGDSGQSEVVEGEAAYEFDDVWIFAPTVSALIGRRWGEENKGGLTYTYWNAGLTLEFNDASAFELDVRYWDTNIAGCAQAAIFQCDERVVGTVNAYF